MATNSTGPIDFQLPKDMKGIQSVELGQSKKFLAYDEDQNTIYKPDEDYVIS